MYVPLMGQVKSRNEQLDDVNYLAELVNIAGSTVWATEMTEAYSQCMALAEKAKSPDELKGILDCVRVLKVLAVMGHVAKSKLAQIKNSREIMASVKGLEG